MRPPDGIARPGLVHGPYPQRLARRESGLLAWADRVGACLGPGALTKHAGPSRVSFLRHLQERRRLAAQADARRTLHDRVHAARLALQQEGWHGVDAVAQAHAVVAEAIEAALGQTPYPGQHEAAWAMLGRPGRDQLVEMATGEGKSLALVLAAGTAALAGVPVHVLTANDYLAARDAQRAQAVFEKLGLRVAAVQAADDTEARRAAYACDVVYATAREVGFDYLRDQKLQAPPAHGASPGPHAVLRGLCLALVDEADSVLIDHARTPLVVASADTGEPRLAVWQALDRLARSLVPGQDFTLDPARGTVELGPGALARLDASFPAPAPGAPTRVDDPRRRRDGLRQALVAHHLMRRDEHYLVDRPADGEPAIVLIDATTGRRLPGTQWTRELAPLVALKEGLPPPAVRRTMGQITLQTLLGRYWKLGGVSGTLREARRELARSYHVDVVEMAPRLPSRRRDLGTRVCRHAPDQLAHIVERALDCHRRGQPLLVGTASVAESDRVAEALRARGLAVEVLHAREDADEARRVAAAGRPGAITVTTNLAGRGTDIPVEAAALAAGGLHVLAAALNASPRIDRQLQGRTARNGQPGSTEAVLHLDGGVFARTLPDWTRRLLTILIPRGGCLPLTGGRLIAALAQARDDSREAALRRRIVAQDRRAQELLAFARSVG